MSEQIRSEFEAWFESLNNCKPAKQITPSGWYYWDQRVDDAWNSWQASRAALCVELPCHANSSISPTGILLGKERAVAIDECAKAIHAAGVKTR